jgi:hypothetical protein
MEKIIREKIIGRCLWGAFGLLMGFFIWAIAIYYGHWGGIVLAVIWSLLYLSIIPMTIYEVKEIKVMYPLRVKLEQYLANKGYRFIAYKYPSYDSTPPRNSQNQLWLIVYDESPKLISLRKISSPFPERYDFYESNPDSAYLYIYDNYRFQKYFVKK